MYIISQHPMPHNCHLTYPSVLPICYKQHYNIPSASIREIFRYSYGSDTFYLYSADTTAQDNHST